MDDWLSRFAAALGEGLPADSAKIDLGPAGEDSVLELARLVGASAGFEHAPLAAFLAGCYVALRAGQGVEATKALEEAVRLARRIPPVDRPPRAASRPPGPTSG